MWDDSMTVRERSPEMRSGLSPARGFTEVDDQNLALLDAPNAVDQINASFYNRFPFPSTPMRFDYFEDPDFETVMLNQAIGDWEQRTVPRRARIWVPGCGTDQAVQVALRFPQARVQGSDLAGESLEISRSIAGGLGLTNLDLKQESLFQVEYSECFDYILCTGVLHHTSDPGSALARLAAALRPKGILELMVYNRYHRIAASAFQKAVAILTQDSGPCGFEEKLSATRALLAGFSVDESIRKLLIHRSEFPDSMLADTLLQPVEHSYTVATLADLAAACGLRLICPCTSLWDRTWNTCDWTLRLGDRRLQDSYDLLPDLQRWQVANLLLHQSSPLLWFYLERQDSGRPQRSEQEICESFLATVFARVEMMQRSYVRSDDGAYSLSPRARDLPQSGLSSAVRQVLELADGRKTMGEILRDCGIPLDFAEVNPLRIRLTTPTFPYLRAVSGPGSDRGEAPDREQIRRDNSASLRGLRGATRRAAPVQTGDR